MFQGKPTRLTGGEFGPEASVFGVVADLAMLAVIWKWPVREVQSVALAQPAVSAEPVNPA